MMGASGSGPASGSGGSEGLKSKSRIGAVVVGGAFLFLVGAIIAAYLTRAKSPADPDDARQVARGKPLYDTHCASCHGARLEGQPDWQVKLDGHASVAEQAWHTLALHRPEAQSACAAQP